MVTLEAPAPPPPPPPVYTIQNVPSGINMATLEAAVPPPPPPPVYTIQNVTSGINMATLEAAVPPPPPFNLAVQSTLQKGKASNAVSNVTFFNLYSRIPSAKIHIAIFWLRFVILAYVLLINPRQI